MCLTDFARQSVLYCTSPADLLMSLLSSAVSKFPDFPFVHESPFYFDTLIKNAVVPLKKSLDKIMFWIALQFNVKLPNLHPVSFFCSLES